MRKHHIIPLLGVICSAIFSLMIYHYWVLNWFAREMDISPEAAGQSVDLLIVVAAAIRCLLIINNKDDITNWIDSKFK
jgi:hypothetical protein